MVESLHLTRQQQLTGQPKEAPQVHKVGNDTSSYTTDIMRTSAPGASGRVRTTYLHGKNREVGDLDMSTAEIKAALHRIFSPQTGEPSPKRHKGKQKESSREILEEVLNNLEDEMVCPMLGSE